MSEEASCDDLETEVTRLVRDLTAEILLRRPTNIYTCCANYVERRLRQRDAVSAKAVSEEREITKMRMHHLESIEDAAIVAAGSWPTPEKKKKKKKKEKKHATEAAEQRSVDGVDSVQQEAITREQLRPAANQRKHSNGSDKVPPISRRRLSDLKKYTDENGKELNDKLVVSALATEGLLEGKTRGTTDAADIRLPPIQAVDYDRPSSSSSGSRECPASRSDVTKVGLDQLLHKELGESISEILNDSTYSAGHHAVHADRDDGYESHSSTLCLVESEDTAHSGDKPTPVSKATHCLRHFSGHEGAVTQCRIFDHYLAASSLDGRLCIWNTLTAALVKELKCHKPIHDFLCITCPNRDVLILVGTDMGKLLLWKVCEQGELVDRFIGVYAGHLPNPVRTLASSADGQLLATGCCFLVNQVNVYRAREQVVRGTLKLWDLAQFVEDGQRADGNFTDKPPILTRTMQQLTARCLRRRASFSRYMAMTEGEHMLWGIRALAFTPDSKKLVVGFGHPQDAGHSDTNMLVVCCARTLDTLWVDSRARCQVNSLSFAPESPEATADFINWELIVGCQAALTRTTLVYIGETRVELIIHWHEPVARPDHYAAALPPVGEFVVSAVGGDIIFWDKPSGRKLHRIQAHSAPITKITFSPEGLYLCTASQDRTLKLWRIPDELRERDPKARWKDAAKNVAQISQAVGAMVNRKKTVTY